MDDYIQSSRKVLSICSYYLQCALQLCPDNLKWKIWLLLARTYTFAGSFTKALKVCFYNDSHS